MSQIFSNTQLDINQLPKLSDIEFVSISKNYLKLLIFRKLIFIVILSLALIAVNFYINDLDALWIFRLVLPAIIFISLLNLLISYLGFKKRKYAIREKDIIYAKGLLKHTQTVVPYTRIQHIELNQGFLAKKFDVATLHIYTAGESGSDLSIPGIRSEKAKEINGFLSTKISELS